LNLITNFKKHLLDEKFDNVLLFMCYAFYEAFKNKPKSYKELVEFATLKTVDALVEQYAASLSQVGEKDGQQ